MQETIPTVVFLLKQPLSNKKSKNFLLQLRIPLAPNNIASIRHVFPTVNVKAVAALE